MKLKNRSAVFAWLLSLFCALGATATVIDWFLKQPAPIGLLDILNAVGWQWGFPVLYSVVAALIIARLPRNRVGWLLMLPALANIASLDRFMATPPATLTPALWLLLWFDNWSWIPVIFPIFLIPLHFPSGQPPSPRWRWVNWLAGGLWLFFMLLMATFATLGPANFDWTLPNPVGLVPIAFNDGPLLIFWGIGLLTTVSGSVASLFVRYRSARTGERQQIKWLLFAGAIFIVVYAAVYFGSAGGQFGTVSGAMNLLFVLVILAFPAAIGIAILRYQLFDIDVIIRKTVVYAVLSALLALVYFGMVVLLQGLFEALSGAQSPIAVVISTLVIAALFSPLRRWVQVVIDRRFFRRKFDAQVVLDTFAIAARDEVALDGLTIALLRAVQETLQPASRSVWLVTSRE